MEKKWQVCQQKYQNVLLQLLYNRGVIRRKDDKSAIENFLKPDFVKDLHDPYLLLGMKKVIKRIELAKNDNQKIGIYADYDADGIPGAALLHKALDKIGIQNVVYIPMRSEGYGMSKKGIDSLIDKGCKVIVTVDLGIKDFDQAKYCTKRNIDLIITDHHLPSEEIPKAFAIINPKIKGNRYPFRDLSGTGVVYKLIQALSNLYPKIIDESFLKWNLDLVAISTISDMVPLVGENRTLAKYGLIVLQKSKNLGVLELIKIAGIDSSKICSYDIGFKIGPRINASGRIDRATKSYCLLTTNDRDEAKRLAVELEEKNTQRQQITKDLICEASVKIEKNKLDQNNIIILKGRWPKGVLGPSASNISEKYYRPTILLTESDKFYSGSVRSFAEINIMNIILAVSDKLQKFGGHKGAAGITVLKSKFDQFVKSILNVAKKKIDKRELIPQIDIDMELEFNQITQSLYSEISRLEPYGMGNRKPVFTSSGIDIESAKFVGRDQKHLSAYMRQGNKKIKSIYFNYQDDKNIIKSGKKCQVAYTIINDSWNGRNYINLNIIDLKIAS